MYAPYEEQEIEELKSEINVLTFKSQEYLSAIQRVRELHKQVGNVCHTCSTFDTAYLTLYPCPTIKALDGEQ